MGTSGLRIEKKTSFSDCVCAHIRLGASKHNGKCLKQRETSVAPTWKHNPGVDRSCTAQSQSKTAVYVECARGPHFRHP